MKTRPNIGAVLVYTNGDELRKELPVFPELQKRALAELQKAFPEAPILAGSAPDTAGIKLLSSHALYPALKEAASLCHTKSQSIALCYDWYPLFDQSLFEELYAEHEKFLAHFSYAENVPYGFVPDLCSVELIEELPQEAAGDLRAFMLKNIDKYDVEIFYKRPDLRCYRLDFSTKKQRSQLLAYSFLQENANLRYAELEEAIHKNPSLLRPYPSYFEIELSTRCRLRPFYWPEADCQDRDLDWLLIEKLIEDIRENAIIHELTITLGGLGEASLHPQFQKILPALLALPQVELVYLESFGGDLQDDTISRLGELPNLSKLHIIIALSTLQKERYLKFYGEDELDLVLEKMQRLEKVKRELTAGKAGASFHLYTEMIRMRENTDEVDSYFQHFQNTAFQVILQKYNSYIDKVPQRMAADLSPLNRSFCWHLARDFYLTAAGEVAICKQDPFARQAPSLSFRRHSISQIWSQTMNYHKASIRGEHQKIPMPCHKCDEWYTFNA